MSLRFLQDIWQSLSSWQFNILVSGFSKVRMGVVDVGSIWIVVVVSPVRVEEIIQLT